MQVEEVYQDYLALKAHFGSNYNYQRYEGKIKTSLTSSNYKRVKIFCAKVAKHKDPHRFLLANMVANPKMFIGSIAYSEEAERIYVEYVKKMDSLSYVFKQDIKKLENDIKSNLKTSSTHPNIVLLYFAKEITLETLCIVSMETKSIDTWDGYYQYDPVMQDLISKVRKYTPFIQYDRAKFRKLLAAEFADR